MANKPVFWGPSLFLSSGNRITWMQVCHICIYTYICLTPGRIHMSPHAESNWDMIEYEYLEQRQLHIKLGLVSCKHQRGNQTASRAKHSEDLTPPNNPSNPNWPLDQPRAKSSARYIYDVDWHPSNSVPWCWEERCFLTHWSTCHSTTRCGN